MRHSLSWIIVISLVFVPLAACDPVSGDGGDFDGGPSDGGGAGVDAELNVAPTAVALDNASIAERSLDATVVGILSTTDANLGDTHTYALADDAGGRFAVSGDELVVASSDLLNFEASATHAVVVRATDAGGLTHDETLTVTLTDVLEVLNSNADGVGSLAQAVADVTPGGTILFELGVSGQISLGSTLVIGKSMTIRGNASPVVSVSGRTVLQVAQVVVGTTVTIQNLIIENGSASSGAGIENNGTLTLERVLLRNNIVSSAFGRGGAIRNFASLTLRESTLRGNTAFNGGGIINDGPSLIVDRSLFVDNFTTGNSGGAIGATGIVTVINSTFTNNKAPGGVGGGLAQFASKGGASVLNVINCTIVDGSADDGGGIYNAATLNMRGTIVANNVATTGADILNDGTATSRGFNVISNGAGSGFTNGAASDQVGVAQALSSLSDFGGPTESRGIAAGSPAHDAIPVANCLDAEDNVLSVDQRSRPRPGGSACDVGAFERQ